MTKREQVTEMVIDMFDRIGIDTPYNFGEINDFIYEDVDAAADPDKWHDGDVAIAFRRWIESKSED